MVVGSLELEAGGEVAVTADQADKLLVGGDGIAFFVEECDFHESFVVDVEFQIRLDGGDYATTVGRGDLMGSLVAMPMIVLVVMVLG